MQTGFQTKTSTDIKPGHSFLRSMRQPFPDLHDFPVDCAYTRESPFPIIATILPFQTSYLIFNLGNIILRNYSKVEIL